MSASGHTGRGIYWAVFAGLAAFTVITVASAYLHLPMSKAVPLALAIATVKAWLVGAYFMHLKGEKAVIFAFLGLTAAFVVVLVTLPLLDITDLSATEEGAIPPVHAVHAGQEAGAATSGDAPAAPAKH